MRQARRTILRATACAALAVPLARAAVAQAAPAAAVAAPVLRVLQCVDPDPSQQEHVRDFVAGLQVAFKSTRRSGGPLVQAVQMACDGTPEAVAAVGRRLAADDGLLALVGTPTERASLACLRLADAGAIAHIAPWLPDTAQDHLCQVANLFASRDEQLRQSIAALASMGLAQLGVVFESTATRDIVAPGVGRALAAARLRAPLWSPAPGAGIEQLVASLPDDAPAVLAFAGGAIELSRFMRALASRSSARMVLSLNAVDQGLLQQLGAAREQPLMLAQTVPNPARASLPLVRQFRDLHAQLFDDAPSTSGLAGFIAGRYTLWLLERLPPAPTRRQLLDELQRRQPVDLDGYELSFRPGRNRGSSYVALTMLTREGRLIGQAPGRRSLL